MSSGAPVAGSRLRWLEEEGEDREIVFSTRVRLARNLQGSPFAVRAGSADRQRVLEQVRTALDAGAVLERAPVWEIASLDPLARRLLLERHLVSRDLVGDPERDAPPGAALALEGDGTAGVMINEEDHLRLQALAGGFGLEGAWRRVERLDDTLGSLLPYAYHHEFGFLTSCPTNVGTGLRASVLIHLPGLVLIKEISRVLDGISQVGLTYRGLYGEGSEVVGNFFQISNQTTLGKSEEDLVDHLAKVVGKVVEYEKGARTVLLREAPAVIEDKVWRAYGILRHARSLSFEELMNLLSGLRLGVSLKLLPTPRVETLNRIMIRAQNAHLESAAGHRLEDVEADLCRATYVRETLAEDKGAGPRGRDSRGEPDDAPGAS